MQRIHGLSAEEARRITAKEDTPVDPEVAAAAAEAVRARTAALVAAAGRIMKAEGVVGAEEMAGGIAKGIVKKIAEDVAEETAGSLGRVAAEGTAGGLTRGAVEEAGEDPSGRTGAGEELVTGMGVQPKPGMGQAVASGVGVSSTEATAVEFGAEGVETAIKIEMGDDKSCHQL